MMDLSLTLASHRFRCQHMPATTFATNVVIVIVKYARGVQQNPQSATRSNFQGFSWHSFYRESALKTSDSVRSTAYEKRKMPGPRTKAP